MGKVIATLAVVVLCTSAASAQSASKGYGSTSASGFMSKNRSARLAASKPFSSINRGPTVSPYLALSNPRGQVSDYFNIVKPQRKQRRLNQQQQRMNQQLLRQNLANQHRLNEMAAGGPYGTRGSDKFAPTGHVAVHQNQLNSYLNMGDYFPPPSKSKNSDR